MLLLQIWLVLTVAAGLLLGLVVVAQATRQILARPRALQVAAYQP